MGIAVEPIDSGPCVDSDCYYAQGETLTSWSSIFSNFPLPNPFRRWVENPRIDPPREPTGESGDSTTKKMPAPPPQSSTSPTPPDPLPPVASDDPLYSVIAQLLDSRQPTTQPEPIVLAPPPSNPSLALWVIALAVVGVLGYAWLQRR